MIRRASQISFFLFFILLPYFNILRYDSYHKQLYLFGVKWQLGIEKALQNGNALEISWQFFIKAIVPWIGVLAFFPIMGFLLGRTFCGWLCPEGLLFEIADFFSERILGRKDIFRSVKNSNTVNLPTRIIFSVIAILFYSIVPATLGFLLSAYFIPPELLFSQLKTLNFSTGVRAAIIGMSIYVFITSILLRHIFCKYICAPGLMQVLFGWVSPISMKLRFKREEFSRCTDCRACEKVCFMNVKPRSPKANINCVNCGECIEACSKEIGKPLFEFVFKKHEANHKKTPLKDISLNGDLQKSKKEVMV